MATISKFYLLDAATPNTGTMPSGILHLTATRDADTGDATGARTARDANDVAGVSNPDIESTFTATANVVPQAWGWRRFVSRPLAAVTLSAADGNWTWSYARSESDLLHNSIPRCSIYVWRPSTGGRVGSPEAVIFTGTEPTVAATEQAQSITAAWSGTVTLVDGDILVFDIGDYFSQGMSTAYTAQFAYNGTTEASTTTCASFVAPPAALTLYTAATTTELPTVNFAANIQ